MSRSKLLFALAFLAILFPCSAQPPSPAAAPTNPSPLTGSVTGYVVYAESQLPARFAEIRLVPKPADLDFISLIPINKQPNDSAEPSQKKLARLEEVVGSTGMDGTFRLDGVPFGDYFAAALKPGYVTPGAGAQMDASQDQLKSIVQLLSVVHVGVGQVATVNLTLHRGGVISGRMHYADGSPAIGASVDAEPPVNILFRTDLRNTTLSPLQNALQSLSLAQAPQPRVLTDDEGRYRIFGLPPGKYIVTTLLGLNHSSGQVVMDDGSSAGSGREHMYPELIVVYQPATFRRKEAKVFEISGDEQITDADLTIDPAGLHTIRGRVLAAEDHHAPSGAMVRVLEEGAKDVGRFAEIEYDGSFQINYLPSGTYTIRVDASDLPPISSGGAQGMPLFYKTAKLTVAVGDTDVILDEFLLPKLKPGEKNPEF